MSPNRPTGMSALRDCGSWREVEKVMRFHRIERLADVIVGGDAPDLEQRTGVVAEVFHPSWLLAPASPAPSEMQNENRCTTSGYWRDWNKKKFWPKPPEHAEELRQRPGKQCRGRRPKNKRTATHRKRRPRSAVHGARNFVRISRLPQNAHSVDKPYPKILLPSSRKIPWKFIISAWGLEALASASFSVTLRSLTSCNRA